MLHTRKDYCHYNKMLSYRRDRAAGCVIVFAKCRRLNWDTIFYGHYRSIFNHYDIIGLKICRIRWKKRKIRAITPFKVIKVIEIGTNQKLICDFLLVINSNWHPISYRFRVIAAYCSNIGHFAFLSPLWGLGITYDVHLGLIAKRVVDFLVLIELFFARRYGWVAMSEKRPKIGDFAPVRSVWSKISGRMGRPNQSFLHG